VEMVAYSMPISEITSSVIIMQFKTKLSLTNLL